MHAANAFGLFYFLISAYCIARTSQGRVPNLEARAIAAGGNVLKKLVNTKTEDEKDAPAQGELLNIFKNAAPAPEKKEPVDEAKQKTANEKPVKIVHNAKIDAVLPEEVKKNLNPSLDACGRLAVELKNYKKAKFVDFDLVKDCYKSFPLNKKIMDSTMDTVTRLLELYAFYDYNLGTVPPKMKPKDKYDNDLEKMQEEIDDAQVDNSVSFNLKTALKKVGEGSYASDFQFQEALSKVFLPARDGHLLYHPNCYRQFSFIQPLMLASYSNLHGEVVLQLRLVDPFAPDELKAWVGATVTHIDGMNAVKYLVEYGLKKYGNCRSAPTRFSQLVSQVVLDQDKNILRAKRGSFCQTDVIPDKNAVVWTFEKDGKSKELEIKWHVPAMPPDFKDGPSYWNKYCAPPKPVSQVVKQPEPVPIKPPPKDAKDAKPLGTVAAGSKEKDVKDKADSAAAPKNTGAKKDSTGLPVPISVGPGLGFFIQGEEGDKYGVIMVSTFAVSALDKWANSLLTGLNLLKAKGINKILVDFSNNGGGSVCAAYVFSRTVSASEIQLNPFPFPNKVVETRVRVVELLEDIQTSWMAQNGTDYSVLTPYRFNCKVGDTFSQCPKDTTWGDLEAAEKSNLKLRQSPVIIDRCTEKELKAFEPLKGFKMWTKDVFLFTNGYCGSACAIALSTLRYDNHFLLHYFLKPPCYSVPKQDCESRAPFVYAGGQVLSSADFFWNAKASKFIDDPRCPKEFLTNVEFKMAYRALIDRQYPLDLMHWGQNYLGMTPIKGASLKPDVYWHLAIKAVGKYSTARSKLLVFRDALTSINTSLDALYEKRKAADENLSIKTSEEETAQGEKTRAEKRVKNASEDEKAAAKEKLQQATNNYNTKLKATEEANKEVNALITEEDRLLVLHNTARIKLQEEAKKAGSSFK